MALGTWTQDVATVEHKKRLGLLITRSASISAPSPTTVINSLARCLITEECRETALWNCNPHAYYFLSGASRDMVRERNKLFIRLPKDSRPLVAPACWSMGAWASPARRSSKRGLGGMPVSCLLSPRFQNLMPKQKVEDRGASKYEE
jgi:hypothetical protein